MKAISILAISLLLIIIVTSAGYAQSGSAWPPMQNIPGIALDTWTPILIADRNRTVHAFYSQWLDQAHTRRAIVYNQWTKEQGWTLPVDILLSPHENEAQLVDAYLDRSGIIHVIFMGGVGREARLYYSNAKLSDATNARSWSEPTLAAWNAQDPPYGRLFVDDDGNINLIFSGNQDGTGLYLTESNDRGDSWTRPVLLAKPMEGNSIIDINLYEGETGWIHAIWNEVSSEGQGRRIYYSKVKNGSSDWSAPILLAESESGFGTLVPDIIELSGKVFAIYIQTLAEGNHKIKMCVSKDGGFTWEDPQILFPRHTGVSGHLSLVMDSNGSFHIIFIQRIPGLSIGPDVPDIGGIWQSTCINGQCGAPEKILFMNENSSMNKFPKAEPYAVISQGNMLLLTVMADRGIAGNGVWYSTYTLDAPELPVEAFAPAPSLNPTVPAKPAETPATTGQAEKIVTVTPVSSPTLLPTPKNESSNVSLITSFSIGLLPAILVIAIVIFVRSKLRANRE